MIERRYARAKGGRAVLPPREIRRDRRQLASTARRPQLHLGRRRLLDGPLLGVLSGVSHRSAAGRATHGSTQHEDPSDVRHWLAADQPPFVEEPLVLAVELLERVVREDIGIRTIGDLQHERVAASDRTCRRSEELTLEHCFLERLSLLRIDAMTEGRVDDNSRVLVRILLEQRANCTVQLRKARRGASFRRDVRPVHHDMFCLHLVPKSSKHSHIRCGSFTEITSDPSRNVRCVTCTTNQLQRLSTSSSISFATHV